MARSTANARKPKPVPQRRSADDWVRRGRRHDQAGDPRKAMKCYHEAFTLAPQNMEALKLLSRKLIHLTERRVAIEVLERAVEANPGDWEVYLILGNLALEMRLLDAALKLSHMVAQLKPDSTAGPNNMATVLREMERFEEAITLLQEAIPQHPTSPLLWNTLATVVSARDGLEEALPFYEEALRLDPRLATAWSNVARTYEACGRPDAAVEAARKAISLEPDFPEPHFVLGTSLLALGQLEEGWAEYEWRQHWRRPSSLRHTVDCPRWDGSPLDGRSIVVCPEQGIGDELLFATCIPDIAAMTEKFYIGCDRRLIPLFTRSFPGAVVGGYRDFSHNAQRYRHLPFIQDRGLTPDCYIEAGSLFGHVRRTIADFPKRPKGWLVPDPKRVAHWRQELDAAGPGPKVGIAWTSGKRTHERNKNYTDLQQWGDILTTRGVTFVNVQYTDCEPELAAAEQSFGMTIHRPQGIDLKDDQDDLAALIQALDIVIAPPSAPGNLALAVGTEFWVIARKVPYWFLGRKPAGGGSPLGPSRLFLYDEEADWSTTIQNTATALAEYGKKAR